MTWSADSTALAKILGELRTQADVLGRVTPDLATARRDLARLNEEKRVALEELRSGAFCTGCGRTRSDILAAGETFPHRGQQSRPATPDELAHAAQNFDGRIARLRDRVQDLADKEKDAQSALDAAYHRWLVRLPEYHLHINQERQLRLEQWLDEKRSLESDLQQAQQNLQAARQALAEVKPPESTDLLGRDLDRLQREFVTRHERVRAAESRADQDARAFVISAKGDIDRLARLASGLPERFGFPGGAYMAVRVRTTPQPIDYIVPRVARVDPPAATGRVSELLEPGGKPGPVGPKSGPPEKSVRDLLDGK